MKEINLDEYNNFLEKSRYILFIDNYDKLLIFNIIDFTAVIIEDSEEEKMIKDAMLKNGNRIVKYELLKYIKKGRPIPTLIKVEEGYEIYRCAATGETFKVELKLNPKVEIEPEYRLVFVWNNEMPVLKQIVKLRNLYPMIEYSNEELLRLGRGNKNVELNRRFSRYQVNTIIEKGKEFGLNFLIVECYI
ncbi:hypothetical protein SAMN02745163_01305 [Clostridium cavendishii DSM 21758]|uniref:Uncharacterized protein n=1 Tax=Clostridium cavendishii DSM 21758 TaxID=1121302 RepID=A0A1M6GJC8_9CLOT|nr:hypothetical protein [Clostridium cavendishii]SHJ10075.1 hypothetical protein SAMN02745163_01305 [Clostridium cavendishii DSM 21758]